MGWPRLGTSIRVDASVLDYISKGLRESGFAVDQAADGKDGLYRASAEKYDALVVDRMLPGVDGLTIIRTLRGADNNTPALILSALGEVDDRVKGLKAGGDDYLVKPFAFAELLARIESLARRRRTTQLPVLRLGTYEINQENREILVAGKPVELTQKEFELACYMFQNPARLLSRVHLLEAIWGLGAQIDTRTVDTHVSRIRRKLEIGEDAPPLIKTVRGAGYIFLPAVKRC